MRMLITGVKDGKSCVIREVEDAAPGSDMAITNLLDLQLAELPIRPDGHGKLVDTLVPPGLMRWCRVRFVANELRPFHHTDTIDCNTVIDGSIEMILDDGPHKLSVGDSAVMMGVDHSWRIGPQGCTMSILIFGTPVR